MQLFERRAEWIWRRRGLSKLPFSGEAPPYEEETNRYVYFRKAFQLESPVIRATIYASADGRYQLFINGQLVGRGPARCSPAFQTVDPYPSPWSGHTSDLTPYLRPGRNVVAALVHSYGRPTAWYELPQWEQARAFGCGGFFLQGDVVTTAGTVRLDTDSSWRYLLAEAWQRDTPGCSLGFVEVYDARRAPQGWMEADFDDSTWDMAEVLRVPARNFAGDVVPFPMLVPRDIPPLFEEVRFPQAVLSCGEVINAPETATVSEQLAREAIGELNRCRVKDIEALLADEGEAEIATADGRSVSVVIDFGEIVSGRVRFDLDGPAGARVDFTYGERLEPDGRVRMNVGIPGFDDTPQAHRYVLRDGPQTWEQFEWAGFRYLQFTCRDCSRPLRVRSVSVNSTTYPVTERGRFACSDELLNRLWQVGANTLRLCMHDAYEDCPSREQRQWVGDAYVQMLVNFAAFGDSRLAARLLRQVAQSQQPDGLTMMAAPGDFAASSFLNIPDFCLYWVLELGRYVEYTGDTAIVGELYPSLLKAIAWFERHLDEEHLLADVPHWVFIDWAELDKRGQVTALNAQFVVALRTAARLIELADVASQAVVGHYRRLADRIAASINGLLWDEARGVYVDARHHGVQSRRVSQQANAMVIAFDVAPPERWQRILLYILDDERLVLTRTGDADTTEVPFDEEQNVVMAQPFCMHHLHRALSKAGLYSELLDNIRRRWGAMVQDGETTFRETWQLHDITSKCHAWAATPTFDLSSEVLGVTPGTPGFGRVRIAPQPADLAWAEGCFPTPHGDVRVTWQRADGRFELSVEVPEGTEAEVMLPESHDGSWQRVELDGQVAARGALLLGSGVHRVSAYYCP